MQFYYVNPASEQVGPVSIEDLKKAGINRDTLVWRDGMKEWQPAGSIEDLRLLFAVSPPPVERKAALPPSPPPLPGPRVSRSNNRNKIIGAGVAVAVLIVAGLFMFLRSQEPDNQVLIADDADTAAVADGDTSTYKQSEADTAKVIHPDSLKNNLKWDTTANVDIPVSTDKDVSFLPGFGPTAPAPDKKVKKTATKKSSGKVNRQEEQQPDENRENAEAPREREPERVNPVRSLTISGSFRKNLFFEAVMEGTIQNNSGSQVRDVVVEVTFLDGSGQSVGAKRFTHNSPIPASSGSPFRFKATAPKGTKNARYEVTSASNK